MTGRFHNAAIFMVSYIKPCAVAPSPKKQTVTSSWPNNLAENAEPVAMPIDPPTIALAPRLPLDWSAMCMDPPLPRQYPSSLPKSSQNISLNSAPLATQWPWPRCVEVILSVLRKASQMPTATASSPEYICVRPGILADKYN